MTHNQIAILLESISFVLVTLDLYGKERLEKFQSTLTNQLDNIEEKDLQLKILLFIMKPKGFFIVITPMLIFIVIMCKYGANTFSNPYFLALGYIIAAFAILLRYGDKLISSILSMMKKYKLEGFMLFLGSMLFFVSKLISFF